MNKSQITYLITVRDKQGNVIEYPNTHKTDADMLHKLVMNSDGRGVIRIHGTMFFVENLASIRILEATSGQGTNHG